MFPSQRRSKYGNVRSDYNGRTFASKREADTAGELDMLRKAKDPKQRVVDVEYQYRMPLVVNGLKIATYVADFKVTFFDKHTEIWDAKGMRTVVYTLKAKLVKALYGIDIKEV